MTTPAADAVPAPVAPATPAPLWEDFIDIFHSPSAVFERRRNANPWPMIFIVTALITVIGVLTWNSLAPVYETEARAQMAQQMASNPQAAQAPQSSIETGLKISMFTRRWGGIFFPIGALVMALPVWLLGRIVGAKELTYTRSLVVVTWASIIAVLAALVLGVQGLLLDVSSMTTADKLSLSPARFVDKSTMNAFAYAALKSLDVFAIWSLIVMAIGVRVTGRATRNSAIAFAAIWFVVALLISGAFAARAAAAAAG